MAMRLLALLPIFQKHFRTGNEAAPEIKDLMLDIGASSQEEVRERGIEIGDTIVPDTSFTQLSEYRYIAKAWISLVSRDRNIRIAQRYRIRC